MKYDTLNDSHGPRAGASTDPGFSLIEVIIAITIFVVIVGIALLFLRDAHKNLETESGALETQQSARLATDELARNVQQIGYGINRANTNNSATWQRDLIYGDPYVLAFNADIDSSKGPLSGATTLTFPDGTTYKGEGTAGVTTGAETYVYTIDANGDGTISTTDHTAAASGVWNPAADTDNPLDYALFRRIYGFDGSGYGGTLVPITGSLFTNATTSDIYGDSTSPDPLFTYWLTEDLKGDNVLADTECVVTPCPPSTTRQPVLYMWGDTNFDGRLSESEKTALRSLPVGSPAWSGNRLASGGSFYSTTLSSAYDPATSGSVLKVANAGNFGMGEHVQIGSGGSAEKAVIGSADTAASPDEITLTTGLSSSHAAGETVVILPQTLLRAVRSVQVNFDAIAPKKDYDIAAGGAAVGRSGRAGTKGLEYRVRGFERKVDLMNLTTGALQGAASATPSCPTTFQAVCSGSATSAISVFNPRSTTVPISFVLTDYDGLPMTGKTVTFSNTASLGTLSSASVVTDGSGLATVQYTPTGVVGADVITASNDCINTSLASTTMTASETINLSALEVTRTGNDCLRTYRSGYAAPSSTFNVKVKDPSGTYLTNYPFNLSLAFDTAYLPGSPDYSMVTGQLTVGGSSVGTTSTSTGVFGPYATTTQPGGTQTGALALTSDVNGNGARLVATAQVPDTACSLYGTTAPASGRFYKLTLASVNPNTTCTESAPCSIPSDTLPLPLAKATLSLNSVPISGVPITFTSDEFVKPSGSAATIMTPSSGWTTDSNGDASVQVTNNNDTSITSGNPLKTHIDASSTGEAAYCASGSIAASTLRPEFDYLGPTFTSCDVDIQQAYVKKNGSNDKLCIDVKNTSAAGGCSVSVKGAKFAVYKSGDNINVDTTKFKITALKGGDDNTSSGTCSTSNSVQLFIKNCNRFCVGGVNIGQTCAANGDCPGSSCSAAVDLTNNTQWNFMNYGTTCYVPPTPTNPTDPGQYFVINTADFSDNICGLSPKRRFVITVYYQCAGVCSSSTQSKTFDLLSP